MKLDAATFLLQWATGGLAFCWVTTRRREVSLGYGWLLRSVFGVMAAGAAALFATQDLTVGARLALAGAVGVVVVDRGRARACRSCAGARGVRGREAAARRAPRAGRRRWSAAKPTEMPDRERLPGVPARRST